MQDVGDLYLFDSRRLSQLYLPSGKTRKKIPAIQNYLDDVQGFGISANGKKLNRSSQTVKKNKVMMGIRCKLDVIFQLPLAPDRNKSQGLTEQRRMCCLCFDIWKWLDFQFFLDKFSKLLALSPSCIFTVLVTRRL